jgi:HK97 gp10 family phage protein
LSVRIGVKVNLNGVDQKLKDVGPKLARRAMRKALRSVGTMWMQAIQAKVPVLTDELRDSIGVKIRTRKYGRAGSVSVGPTWGDGPTDESPGLYGKFVEFGTKVADYPKQPFMRPVFDATQDKAVEMFAAVLRDELNQIADTSDSKATAGEIASFKAGMAYASESAGGGGDYDEDIGGIFQAIKGGVKAARNPKGAVKSLVSSTVKKLS